MTVRTAPAVRQDPAYRPVASHASARSERPLAPRRGGLFLLPHAPRTPIGDLRLDHTTDNLLRVDLPAGTTRFAVGYEPDVWDRLGVALTLLTLAALATRQLISKIFSRTA